MSWCCILFLSQNVVNTEEPNPFQLLFEWVSPTGRVPACLESREIIEFARLQKGLIVNCEII